MLSLNSQDILYRYQQVIDNLIPALKTNESYKDRTAKMVAILILTGELFQECCQVQFSMTAVRDILLDIVEKNTPEAESLRAYEDIRQMVEINRSMFDTGEGTKLTGMIISHKSHYGFIKYFTESVKTPYETRYSPKRECAVFILRNVFDRWMKDLGYSNVENILKEWRDVYSLMFVKDHSRIHFNVKVRLSDGSDTRKCVGIRIPLSSTIKEEDLVKATKESFAVLIQDKAIREIENDIPYEYREYVQELLVQNPRCLIDYFTIILDDERLEEYVKHRLGIKG